jgi:predicted glycosyltransferase involved in capsule biosynthesis
MKDLTDLTFIIPIYIDSTDRLNNVKTILGYLNHNFKTNIIIHELIDNVSTLELNSFNNLNINHITEYRNNNNYHRTRQLNEMLNITKTSVVVNYDIDVLLPIDSYIKSYNMINNNDADIVYPYGLGNWQKRVYQSFNREQFNKLYDIDLISNNIDTWDAAVGHCFFIRTSDYKKAGGENEKFIAYGPEDCERFERFKKINLRIERINDWVYHFEHYRREFSNIENPSFTDNEKLFDYLKSLDRDAIELYYKNIDYIKKYKFNDN